jgi:large conductance mechanosensitive channel
MAIKNPEILHKTVQGFFQFIREQGVVGLAIGFILGGAINKLVGSLVSDIIQPAISMGFGTASLADLKYGQVMYGKFLMSIIDFVVLAAVVYFGFKGLKLDKLDLKKEEKK